MRRKVPHQRAVRLVPEQLRHVGPVLRLAAEVRVPGELGARGLKGAVQLLESLLLALLKQHVELFRGVRSLSELADVAVERLRVLQREGEGVVLGLQLPEQVGLPHVELVSGPAPLAGDVADGRLVKTHPAGLVQGQARRRELVLVLAPDQGVDHAGLHAELDVPEHPLLDADGELSGVELLKAMVVRGGAADVHKT
ncbi:hypothetical protein Micbo1qcDRAFT_168903, partial [Microdochium bolleyi]